jgi:hypothetical protein
MGKNFLPGILSPQGKGTGECPYPNTLFQSKRKSIDGMAG